MTRKIKVELFFLVALCLVGCGGPKDKPDEPVSATSGFNAILFNVNATSIKGGNADSVERLDKRFYNINLTGTESIWPEHKQFFMHG